MTKLLIVIPALSTYRAQFYEQLSAALGTAGVELRVAVGGMSAEFHRRGDSVEQRFAVPVRTWTAGRGTQPVAWRRLSDAMPDPDLVVVQQAIKNLETYPLLLRQHGKGPGIAMWGQGFSVPPQRPSLSHFKQWLVRRAEWFFAYTQGGADYVAKRGFPQTRISVLNNTIDTLALASDLAAVDQGSIDEFVCAHRLAPGRTALFLGGVDERKGIRLLLSAAHETARLVPGFTLLIGGAGSLTEECERAERDGAPIRNLGRLTGRHKALALRAADVLAIPEWIGLVAVDSLVAGRPIISTQHDSHSAEVEYLDDATAVFSAHDSDSYARALADTLLDQESLMNLQQACQARSAAYPMSHMVDEFVDGVVAWQDIRRAGL